MRTWTIKVAEWPPVEGHRPRNRLLHQADAILVFAVTEYDPYRPPVVGIAAQLYGFRSEGSVGSVDPLLAPPEARTGTGARCVPAAALLAQAERVFDASQESVVYAVKTHAAQVPAEGGPLGWEKYLAS
ncbi:MAG: hypothetical protein V2A79_19100 [Planctomycetota bacterium]